MHPTLRAFPSRHFYEGTLTDAEDMAHINTRDWHRQACFGPLAVFDVRGEEEDVAGGTRQNQVEAEVVTGLIARLLHRYSSLAPKTIGVISPYKGQVKLIRDRLVHTLVASRAQQVCLCVVSLCRSVCVCVCVCVCVRVGGLTRVRSSSPSKISRITMDLSLSLSLDAFFPYSYHTIA